MAQPSQPEENTSPPIDLADRVARYRQEVERVVREVGEHPQFEMKRSCSLSNLSEKIEFVKDIQSIATSIIETEKYLVIGADEKTKTFCTVTNSDEFDDASIRQILEKYLSPIPLFHVFRLQSSDSCVFILFVIPRQPRRRILAKVTVAADDPKDLKPKLLLREGDLWTKGSSSGKRLAKSEDWDSIYEEVIEAEAEQRARVRTAHSIELAVAREKLRPYGHSSLPSVFTDDEFQALMEDVCASKDDARFKVVSERLRDDTVESWHSIDAYEGLFHTDLLASAGAGLPQAQRNVRNHIKNVLRPGVRWLTLAGIYTVKYGGPVAFLDTVSDLLSEVFETTHRLRTPREIVPQGQTSRSIEEHISHTVPALESLTALHLIGAYIAKRRRFEYLRSVFRGEAFSTGWQGQDWKKRPIAFWPLDMDIAHGEPAELRSWGGRLNFCSSRVRTDVAYRKLLGSETATIEALCQYEFCLELNSFIAMPNLSPETAAYVTQLYPHLNFVFHADLISFSLQPLSDLASGIFNEVKQAKPKLLKQILFDSTLAVQMTKPGADKIFGHFLDDLSRSHAQLYLAKHHFPPDSGWALDLANELKRLRENK